MTAINTLTKTVYIYLIVFFISKSFKPPLRYAQDTYKYACVPLCTRVLVCLNSIN